MKTSKQRIDLEGCIRDFTINNGHAPILSEEIIRSVLKKMPVEIITILLHPEVNFEWWHVEVKAKESFVESFYSDKLNMEIIGVNFDSRALLIEIKPRPEGV